MWLTELCKVNACVEIKSATDWSLPLWLLCINQLKELRNILIFPNFSLHEPPAWWTKYSENFVCTKRQKVLSSSIWPRMRKRYLSCVFCHIQHRRNRKLENTWALKLMTEVLLCASGLKPVWILINNRIRVLWTSLSIFSMINKSVFADCVCGYCHPTTSSLRSLLL